jgi:hypothetical protein
MGKITPDEAAKAGRGRWGGSKTVQRKMEGREQHATGGTEGTKRIDRRDEEKITK